VLAPFWNEAGAGPNESTQPQFPADRPT